MSSEQDKDLVAKKKHVACRARLSRERSDHISFRAESVFLKIPLRWLNTLTRPSLSTKYPFGNCYPICGIG